MVKWSNGQMVKLPKEYGGMLGVVGVVGVVGVDSGGAMTGSIHGSPGVGVATGGR